MGCSDTRRLDAQQKLTPAEDGPLDLCQWSPAGGDLCLHHAAAFELDFSQGERKRILR
jgi:hypothetical protein